MGSRIRYDCMMVDTGPRRPTYIERVNDPNVDAKPCEYGHYECALRDGGPCSDRVEGEREARELAALIDNEKEASKK